MKRTFGFVAILTIFLGNNIIFSQEDDDVPYLSDDDIASIEVVLPEDIPADIPAESPKEDVKEAEQKGRDNEMPRLNTSQTIYHLLILDRTSSPSNSDIGDIDNKLVLYKFKHGTNGYLIVIYKSPLEGSVFPLFPNRSRILVDLVTARKKTIIEYINSSAFRIFVTSRKISSQMQNILKNDF